MQDNWKKMFNDLNDRLAEDDLWLEVICVGGFVLNQHGVRTTHDVDGFYKDSETITRAIRAVGEKFNANIDNELWLNNSVQNLNPPPPMNLCELLYDFSNLKVYMAPLIYIAGMKLRSAREQDIADVASCIKELNIQSPRELTEQLVKLGFNEFDESLVFEAFGYAYGMEWLEKYYIEHESDFYN